MPSLAVLKRLAIIVWRDGGLSWLWLGLSALPTAIDIATPFWPGAPKVLEGIAWWWGLVIAAAWGVFALSRRILAYETPTLEISSHQSAIDKSWWIGLTNNSARKLESCVLNLERLEDARGARVFPTSFGLVRPGNGINPFPLRPHQPKEAMFATVKSGQIVLFLSGGARQLVEMSLEDEMYVATIAAYSELEALPCKKQICLLRNGDLLSIS